MVILDETQSGKTVYPCTCPARNGQTSYTIFISIMIDKTPLMFTSFYGSICATMFYYKSPDAIISSRAFEFLKDNIDVEFADVSAERLIGTKAGEEKAETIWSIISPFLSEAQRVFDTVETLDDKTMLEGMRHAYKIGMLVAQYYHSPVSKKTSIGKPDGN